ncbi:DUF4019 domain-containing protein [Flavobacteriales bacterium]|nr:DUF4019 domain-containing protein [Flavobacteriales bacterium]
MKKILILVIWILSCSTISAQKYTDQYIKDANKVALSWLSDINHNNYELSYNLLTTQLKDRYDKTTWINLISELMIEFGDINSRVVKDISFQSQIEGLEDGFYVSIEYNSNYKNTEKHIEYLILKQNDKSKWEIFDYNYQFESEKEE